MFGQLNFNKKYIFDETNIMWARYTIQLTLFYSVLRFKFIVLYNKFLTLQTVIIKYHNITKLTKKKIPRLINRNVKSI